MSSKDDKQKMNVLIVEDDHPTRMLLRASITQWDFEVQEANDGKEAWGLLCKKDSPEILILDWLMPNLDGIELCEKLVSEYEQTRPYIILLSNVSGAGNIVKALDAGADAFLFKPFNVSELRSHLMAAKRLIEYRKHIIEKELSKSKIELIALIEAMEKEPKESDANTINKIKNLIETHPSKRESK